MRIAIGVEYDGRGFSGWQRLRRDVRTVQEELEYALSRVANHPVSLTCAGRTDAGVHGLGQVAHFDTDVTRGERNWILGCNTNVGDDVNIVWARQMENDFHARFSARARTYRYVILNRPYRCALTAGRATWIYQSLDVDRMREAAKALVGRHDFTSYRTVACQARSPVREIQLLDVLRHGKFIEIKVQADGFLHHMVRNIAGVLIAIGSGERPIDWAAQVLALRDRTQGGITAPSDGLYFEKVTYPDNFEIPEPEPSYFLFD